MIEKGTTQPLVDRMYSLNHIAEAHQRVEREQRLGPVVVSTGE